MKCTNVQRRLPGYLDGGISSDECSRVREHLEACDTCRQQLERYRRLAAHLANVKPVDVPADLALRIRVRASQIQPAWTTVRLLWWRARKSFEEILEPVAIPATGGVLTALVLFVLVVQNIMVGVPLGGVVPNDLPLNLVQPAQLVSLAPFPVPGVIPSDGHSDPGGLLLEATLNARGEVVTYKILSGPNDTTVQRQLDQVLLFSRFRPQLSFGRPTDGGCVLLSFSGVRVHG